MQLATSFDAFLTNTVNLDQGRLDQLETRVKSIVSYLGRDAVIGRLYQEYIPQGSWAHRTIIKPLPHDEFDGDFLLRLLEVPAWSADPGEYLRQVRAAFKRSGVYRDKVQKKNRCVRVQYVNDCHVDVVPYLVLADGQQLIVNYDDGAFEDTNPQGFTDWMREKDELAGGYLRRVIRLLKYLRDYKSTFSCKSVILTTLVGERVQAFDLARLYLNLPTSLRSIVAALDDWLELNPTMPYIEDPSCPGTSFNHRWDDSQYANFRTQMHLYRGWIDEAYTETDEGRSLKAWQRIFGTDFKLVKPLAIQKAASVAVVERAPNEQFIENMGFERTPRYRAHIEATVDQKAGFRHGPLRAMRRVGKGRSLTFRLQTDAAEPYDVYWKIRNRGPEAAALGQLRGQLMKGGRTHKETTLYTGQHYVEAFVVKDGRVVASDHHAVVID